MYYFLEFIDAIFIVALYICLVFFCFVAHGLKWLTASASILVFFIAVIFSFGGIQMFYIPLVLFVGGSILSKLNKDPHEKKGRNVVQVLSNGLIGVCCLLVHYIYNHHYQGDFTFHAFFYNYHSPEDIAFLACLISFSISVCDTFSSEIGRYFNGATRDIITFKPVKKGLSGGISWEGTFLGGVTGLTVCNIVAHFVFKLSFVNNLYLFLFGFSGMILDSILGSLLQAKYLNKNGEPEEVNSVDHQLVSGYAWCDNNMVNILSNAGVVALFIVLKLSGLI